MDEEDWEEVNLEEEKREGERWGKDRVELGGLL